MSLITTGEMRAYLIRGDGKFGKVRRERSEGFLQEIIEKNTETIFGQKVTWLSQKGKYGDMFGISKDNHLIVVEIKGPKSTGKKHTGYGLAQLRNKFRKIKDIIGSRKEFLAVCEDLAKRHPEAGIKNKIRKIKLTRLDYQPQFYFFSTQFPGDIIKRARQTSRNRRIRRWRPKIHCICLNAYRRGNKDILVMTKFA